MNALEKIIAYKRDEVAAAKTPEAQADLNRRIETAAPTKGFQRALKQTTLRGENALICELKRKSPSAGDILPGANPVDIAKEYESGGASCLSILTDLPSFGGHLQDLEDIRSAVSIPLLRKDFMVDTFQVHEARAYGADCILLIMSVLTDSEVTELYDCARSIDLDVLTEVHNDIELERAVNLDMPLIGVNNRDLKRMVTDLANSENLSALYPNVPMVSESGIKTESDIIRLQNSGFQMFLIGESLMKETNRESRVRALVEARKD